MTAMTPFAFEDQLVRTVMIEDEPWFVAKDVCGVLGITKYRDALARLEDDERGSVLVDTLGGQQELSAINESGVYALVFRSRKPQAKLFRKWVTSEVLPALRRTGRYAMPGARPDPQARSHMSEQRKGNAIRMVEATRRLYGDAAARALFEQTVPEAAIVTEFLNAHPMAHPQWGYDIVIAAILDAALPGSGPWETARQVIHAYVHGDLSQVQANRALRRADLAINQPRRAQAPENGALFVPNNSPALTRMLAGHAFAAPPSLTDALRSGGGQPGKLGNRRGTLCPLLSVLNASES